MAQAARSCPARPHITPHTLTADSPAFVYPALLPLCHLLGPTQGKTTVIRELARVLSDELHKRVVIVDTSNEIGGDGDVPHPAIGGARRMQASAHSRPPGPGGTRPPTMPPMVWLLLLLLLHVCCHRFAGLRSAPPPADRASAGHAVPAGACARGAAPGDG